MEGVGWPSTLPDRAEVTHQPSRQKWGLGSEGSSLDTPHTSAVPALELGGGHLLASVIQSLNYISPSLGARAHAGDSR